MGKILDAFLTDQLRADSGTEGRSPKQKRLCDRGSELQDKLAVVLVYKCGQKKLNNLYYQVKEQR